MLRNRSDPLDAALDDVASSILDEMPLDGDDNAKLFDAAAGAFAGRLRLVAATRSDAFADARKRVTEAPSESPLPVVIEAFLAVHDYSGMPAGESRLLDELLQHEERYWRAEAEAQRLDTSNVLRRQIVALATLTGATSEDEAVELLRLVPDLGDDATRERRGRLARWMHGLYPGDPEWWNRLEPDLLGERLVATTYADRPAIFAGVLASDVPARLAGALDIYARLARAEPGLRTALSPILSAELVRLCRLAADEVDGTREDERPPGSIAAALYRAARAIPLNPAVLEPALEWLPVDDSVLGSLGAFLEGLLSDHLEGSFDLTEEP